MLFWVQKLCPEWIKFGHLFLCLLNLKFVTFYVCINKVISSASLFICNEVNHLLKLWVRNRKSRFNLAHEIVKVVHNLVLECLKLF